MTLQKNIDAGKYWDEGITLVEGCTRVSERCKNCWSLDMEKRFHRMGTQGIKLHPERLLRLYSRKKPTTFSIWNDLFHPGVPFDFILQAWKRMFETPFYIIEQGLPWHTFLILTKRPGIMYARTLQIAEGARRKPEEIWPDNIWLGTTVESQKHIGRVRELLKTPGNHFISYEPALGPVEFSSFLAQVSGLKSQALLIAGAETGRGARPADPDWFRKVRDDCQAAGVPFFLKQVDSKRNRILDGVTHDDLPWNK